jgi:hypothetical protein
MIIINTNVDSMIWFDIIIYGMIWYHTISYDLIWYGMIYDIPLHEILLNEINIYYVLFYTL